MKKNGKTNENKVVEPEAEGLCGVSEPRREDKPVPSPAAPGDGGDSPSAVPITSQPLPAGSSCRTDGQKQLFLPKSPSMLANLLIGAHN